MIGSFLRGIFVTLHLPLITTFGLEFAKGYDIVLGFNHLIFPRKYLSTQIYPVTIT